ncbi:hypothetical protein GWI33_005445 [Rhynchophorus ferrugineus]|uniref:Cytosine-specific methyltransferase n=1 Tax=Rhynchophorus ferrugineus TaxID=354439 RepID=A0A834MJK4_RHYFE|nr:hypothetical protein GWI33_005445 [Rhynchophorus ferrugineus]
MPKQPRKEPRKKPDNSVAFHTNMQNRSDISTTQTVKKIFCRKVPKFDCNSNRKTAQKRKRRDTGADLTVEWIKLPNSVYYNSYKFAKVGNIYINQGDNVLVAPEENDDPQIAHVSYMFEDLETNEKLCHAHFYIRGKDTILGEESDPKELFLVDHCEDIPLQRVQEKVKVHKSEFSRSWHLDGGKDSDEKNKNETNDNGDGKDYFFSKRYDYNQSRFIDFIDNESRCISCFWEEEENTFNTPIYREKSFPESSYIEWKNEKYTVGSAIYIDYEREELNIKPKEVAEENYYTLENLDGDWVWMTKLDRQIIFPERYRKFEKKYESEYIACEPYTVGIIEKITANNKRVSIKVREFYRPEDIGKGQYGDPYLLYWTNCIYTIGNFKKWSEVVKGKCYISNKEHISDIYQWVQEGPSRFYFEEFYDPRTEKIKELPSDAQNIGSKRRRTVGGYNAESAVAWPTLENKLNCLDIYAGCGGLSDGLEKSGLVNVKWAIEINEAAAKSFQLNNPGAVVLQENCNTILSLLKEGKGQSVKMPKKGEVDIIVGGPPCQGYSVINRFKNTTNSNGNNSQIMTYLGFIDYYRPKYFIYENVRNFVNFDKTDYLKRTFKCLLAIGYQISFGVLQAGNYGLPQNRRRFFVVGAAPGLTLPKLPNPTHCFGRFQRNIQSIKVDKFFYDIGDNAMGALGSLPRRTVTIRDAIYDLPYISYDTMTTEMPYNDDGLQSHYARQLRQYCNKSDVVKDHECNPVSALIKKRIQMIPENGNWTDLPNVAITLEDGTQTELMKYCYRTKNQKENTAPRGMCQCVQGDPCNKTHKDIRYRTIIPWSIAHTADRNAEWKNVYGRLQWDGYFGTITTNPEPSRTQGRVIHPDQHRIVSVREYARAQGFHDEYIFVGNTREKYKQIGNAVPPILALAIAREIINAVLTDKRKKNLQNLK